MLAFNDVDIDIETTNQYLYKDQFNVSHLILAAEGSPAGYYYNESTIQYLLSKMRIMESRKEFNVCDSFMISANEILPKLIGNDIRIDYNPEKNAFIAKDAGDFKIENLVWDSLGD